MIRSSKSASSSGSSTSSVQVTTEEKSKAKEITQPIFKKEGKGGKLLKKKKK